MQKIGEDQSDNADQIKPNERSSPTPAQYNTGIATQPKVPHITLSGIINLAADLSKSILSHELVDSQRFS